MEVVKKITLDALHRKLGARMVPFAGYDMPVSYKGIIEEHKSVRTAVGIFDVSHMGVLRVKGREAGALLDKVFTRAPSKCVVGKGAYALMCNESGGTLDDLIYYKIADDDFFVALNASNKESDLTWIRQHASGAVELIPLFESHALFALQGPACGKLMDKLGISLKLEELYTTTFAQVAGVDCTFFVSGYTGERGCEISCPTGGAEKVFRTLLETGADLDIQPIGLGARDTLRTEKGFSLYGHELSVDINPIDAGLSWAVDLENHVFIGKAALQEAKKNPRRKLIALKNTQSRQAPRPEMKVFDAMGTEVGFVSSGTFSPTLNCAIGLAIVSKASSAPYSVDIRGQKVAFEQCKRPFC